MPLPGLLSCYSSGGSCTSPVLHLTTTDLWLRCCCFWWCCHLSLRSRLCVQAGARAQETGDKVTSQAQATADKTRETVSDRAQQVRVYLDMHGVGMVWMA